MSDETNSEVKVEAETEVAAEVETILETHPEPELFDPFVDPDESVVEPNFTSAEFNGHKVEFNEAGDCFISKEGQCLGIAAGAIKKVSDVTAIINQREKGE